MCMFNERMMTLIGALGHTLMTNVHDRMRLRVNVFATCLHV